MKRQTNKIILAILKRAENQIFYKALYFAIFIAALASSITTSFYLLPKYEINYLFAILPITLGVVAVIFLILFMFKKIDIIQFQKILKLSIDDFENIEKLKYILIKEKILIESQFLMIEKRMNAKWKESWLFKFCGFAANWFQSFVSLSSSSVKDIEKKWNNFSQPDVENCEKLKMNLHSKKTNALLKYNALWYFYQKSILFLDIKLGWFLGFAIYANISLIGVIVFLIMGINQDSLYKFALPLAGGVFISFVLMALYSFTFAQWISIKREHFLMIIDFDVTTDKIFWASLVKNNIVLEKKIQKFYDEIDAI